MNVRFGLLTDGFKAPTKIILDTYGRLPSSAKLITSSPETPVFIVQGDTVSPEVKAYPKNVKILTLPSQDGRFEWGALLSLLYQQGICSLFVEGGEKIFRSLIDSGFVSYCHLFVAPVCLGGDDSPSFYQDYSVNDLAEVLQFSTMLICPSGTDFHIEGIIEETP